MGFKFGHNGLMYPLMDGDCLIKELVVTRDFKSAMSFLGYNWNRNRFQSLEDMFHFVTQSPWFDPSLFPLKARNHTGRMRDRKRKSYSAFLDWLQAHPNLDPDKEMPPKLLNLHLQRALHVFPVFAQDYVQALQAHTEKKERKEYFNGSVVAKLTGLEGTELGKFMAYARKCIETTINVDNAEELILSLWKEYNS